MTMAVVFTIFMALLIRAWIDTKTIVVYEYERGLVFKDGKFIKTIGAGKYFILFKHMVIQKVGIRPKIMNMPVQDVLSSDGITLRASVAMEYEVVDPYKAIISIESYEQAVYAAVHASLREIIGNYKIEEVLEMRSSINEMLLGKATGKTVNFGVKFNALMIRDIMFPGELKQIFTQVIQARKEGLAALEKARGESAALRNLANVAKMIETNPNLLKLKLLQTTGNTLVVGLDDRFVDINKKEKNGTV